MRKNDVIEILYELREKVQRMRENGEEDLRTVIYQIDTAISDIDKLHKAEK